MSGVDAINTALLVLTQGAATPEAPHDAALFPQLLLGQVSSGGQISTGGVPAILIVLASIAAVIIGVVVLIYLIVPIGKGIAWLIRHVFAFIFGEIGDIFRMVGALLTGLFFIPLILGNVLIGRWSAASHYGRSLQGECRTGVACVYRMLIGHPLRLVGMGSVVEGIEQRVPQAVAGAPGADKPSRKTGQFDGYQIVGSLPGGGSGGKLYVANPDAIKRAGFERAGQFGVAQVVIKSFSLGDGSSLPQIVRESRALEAAKKMGLVLDHDMTNERFYYVMRYVPGQSLSLVMQQLHAAAGNMGLGQQGIKSAMGYASDLLRTLDAYHRGGLWHKDVKPDNIIVDAEHAHLVDFGLLTHLSSSMTLTTHGTEYFRDPEMVRMALRGVKVHEVDGAKFDLFAAGAVLYAMIENSFPAHGALSQVTKPCPEGIRWIIRRAMTDYDKRYASAAQMLLDLETVRSAPDPFAVTPAMLPSMRVGLDDQPVQPQIDPFVAQAAAAGAAQGAARAGNPGGLGNGVPGFGAAAAGAAGAGVAGGFAGAGTGKPRIRVLNWWTGRHEVEHPGNPAMGHEAPTSPFPGYAPPNPMPPWPQKPEEIGRYAQQVAAGAMGTAGEALRRAGEALRNAGAVGNGDVRRGTKAPAHEQLARARSRMEERRRRAQARLNVRFGSRPDFRNGPNRGVAIAVLAMIGIVAWISQASHRGATTLRTRSLDWSSASGNVHSQVMAVDPPAAPEPPDSPDVMVQQARDAGVDEAIRGIEEAKASVRSSMAAQRNNRTAQKSFKKELAELDKQLAELRSKGASGSVTHTVTTDDAKQVVTTTQRGSAIAKVEGAQLPASGFEQAFTEAWDGGDGRVLVVVDLPKPLSAEQEQAVSVMLLSLAREGITLVGDFPHNPADTAEAAKQLDQLARLLSARGIEPADSDKAKANVSKWLLGEHDLDAALWISPAKSALAETVSKDGKSVVKTGDKNKADELKLAFTVVAPELAKLDEDRRDHVTDVVKMIAETLSGESGD